MSTDTVPTGPITLAPPPWNTKATMYMIPFWTSRATANNLTKEAYHPLEYVSPFASREFGICKGGLGMIQLIRYHETPVGPYDEMILCPGSFEYPVESKDGKKTTKTALRITRIYVSQKYTCWNGRKLWNLPKHLAHFTWTEESNGATTIKVYPHDCDPSNPHRPYDPTESAPGSTTKPFFQTTIKPIRFLPSIPMSTSLMKYVGYDLTLVQPPLPEGKEASQGELPGTKEWVALGGFVEASRRGCLAWGDFRQDTRDGRGVEIVGGEEGFWPWLGRSGLVVKLDRGEAVFPEGRRWDTPAWLR